MHSASKSVYAIPSQFVSLEEVGQVHYLAAGKGEPVVLLHGLAASVVAWRRNISVLAQRYAVYAPDLPGHGDSDKPDIAYSLDEGVRFLSRFLDALRLERAVLVGNSTGGLLALAMALRQPERVRALVLVDIPGLGRELAWPLRLASVPGLGLALEALNIATSQRFAPKLFYRPERIEPSVGRELARLQNDPGVRRAALRSLRHGVNLLGLHRLLLLLHDSPAKIPAPTLIVWGHEDRVTPVEHAHRAASLIPGAQVCVLPDCGHWPQMEQAQAFNEALLAFLAKVVPVEGKR